MIQITIISNENQLEHLKWKKFDIIVVMQRYLKSKCKKCFPNSKIVWFGDIITGQKTSRECLLSEKKIFEDINNIKINKKKVFTDILGYKNYSFLDIDAVRYLSGHRNFISHLIYQKSVIELLLAELKPNYVLLYYPFTDWEEQIEHVCIREGIKIKCVNNNIIGQFNIWIKNYDFIETLKLLKILPLSLKIKSMFLAFKNRFSSNNPETSDILIFSINTKYSDIVLPLLKSLRDDGLTSLVLTQSGSDYINLLNKKNINYVILETYLDIKTLLTIYPIYDRILKDYNLIKKDEEFINKMQDICGTFIAKKIINEIDYSIIFSIISLMYIFTIKKIIKAKSSELLLCTHFSENIINSLFVGCKELNIPTIGLHRGTSSWQTEHSIFYGDKLLVAGKQSQDVFASFGVEFKKIFITGFPIFDNLLKKLENKNAIESKIRSKFNIKSNLTIVTYLTQSFSAQFGYDERQNEIKMVFNAFKQFDDLFLIIKIHPTESNTDIYEYFASKLGLTNYLIVYESEYLDDILISSKIALNKNSTTGFNALIAGCKLIILNTFSYSNFDLNEEIFFLKGNVADLVNNTEELVKNLRILKKGHDMESNEIMEEFIEHHFYKLDYNSINRIKKNIYELING